MDKGEFHPSVLVSYKPKTICLRCGADNHEYAKGGCYTGYKNYSRHLWNKKMVKIPTFSYTVFNGLTGFSQSQKPLNFV